MEQRKQKSQTLPPGVSPGKVLPTANGGLFRRLKRRFRLKSKGYEFGIPEDESVQGVSFRRRSDECSSKLEKDKQNELPRTQSNRRAEKPIITVIYQGNNKTTVPCMNGNGIFEFDKSMDRSFEEATVGVENNFLVTDDQVIDLDHEHAVEENNIFIEPDPGYETLEEVRRKMKLNQVDKTDMISDQIKFSGDISERDSGVLIGYHRRTQSCGTAESCNRSPDILALDNRDSGIGIPRPDVSPDVLLGCSSDTNLRIYSHRHDKPYTVCGNSPNLSRIGSCPIKNGSVNLQDFKGKTNEDQQGFCNSDTCLCQYSENGDLYANPKILFRKRSQKKQDTELSLNKLTENTNDSHVEINLSPNAEGPPLPARKYSMYDDLKTPDSAKSDNETFLNQENVLIHKAENCTETNIKESDLHKHFNHDRTVIKSKEIIDTDKEIANMLISSKETEIKGDGIISKSSICVDNQNACLGEHVSIPECESSSEHADSKYESEITSNVSDTCGSLSISMSSNDTVKCIVLDSPTSTEGESIPEDLEILHISEDDEGLKDVERAKLAEKYSSVMNMGKNSTDLTEPGEYSKNLCASTIQHIKEDNFSLQENTNLLSNLSREEYPSGEHVLLGWISEGLENTSVEYVTDSKQYHVTDSKQYHVTDSKKYQSGVKDISINSDEDADNSTCKTEINNSCQGSIGLLGQKELDDNKRNSKLQNCPLKSFYLEEISLKENDFSQNLEQSSINEILEGATGQTNSSGARQNVTLDLRGNYDSYEMGMSKNNILPTPETSQTQYFSDSRFEYRALGNHHRKSSTMDSFSSFAESDDNSSIRSTEILSDIHVMSYEDDADAILESLVSRRNSFADDLDNDSYGTCNSEAAGQEIHSSSPNVQNQISHLKRLPDFYYDDTEPIHMSLSELGLKELSPRVGEVSSMGPHREGGVPSMGPHRGGVVQSVGPHRGEEQSVDREECSGQTVPVPAKQRLVDIDNRPPAIVPRLNKETAYKQDFMESMQQLKDCGWYWGPLSWEEAEIKLIDKPDGSFLVRDSSDDRYILSLSFNMQGRVHHTRIEHHKGKFSFWSQPDTHGKSTIRQFIEQCVQNSRNGQFLYFVRPSGPGAPPMPVHLLHPVSRFKQMQSLQHMCRFKILQTVRRDHIDHLPLPTFIKSYLKEAQYYVEFLEE